MVPMRHGVAAVVVGDAVGNDIICPGSMSLEVVSCRVLTPIPRVTRAASKAQAAATSVLVCLSEHLSSSVSDPSVCLPSPPAEGEDAVDASRSFEVAAEGMSRADAPLLPDEFSEPLPPPTPRRMGVQPVGARDSRGRWYRWVEHPDAIARGHNRFMLCTCGWLVHLNSTGKAYARAHPSSRRNRHRGGGGGARSRFRLHQLPLHPACRSPEVSVTAPPYAEGQERACVLRRWYNRVHREVILVT